MTNSIFLNVYLLSLGGRMTSVTSDPNTIIIVTKRNTDADCSVCTNDGSKQKCSPLFLQLTNPSNASVEFTCPQPQDVFWVEINRLTGMTIQNISLLVLVFVSCCL